MTDAPERAAQRLTTGHLGALPAGTPVEIEAIATLRPVTATAGADRR
jgi:hypothetical protein